MLKKFLKEEKAQGAIEYILLAGGIIIAAVVIFAVYTRMTKQAAETANLTFACAQIRNATACAAESGCAWNSTYEVCARGGIV